MNIGAASIFIVILVLGLFVNKYVLSVLGFKYPTIFQVNTFLTHNISGNILFFSPPLEGENFLEVLQEVFPL